MRTAFAEFAERIVDVVDRAPRRDTSCAARGSAEAITGDWTPHRVVVMEFESAERARECINSTCVRVSSYGPTD